jgi:catechol 2,3-dioxygenase-like lactoylglutathione lyase family enzyme
MTHTTSPTTVTEIGVAMFTVADQDAALAFYTEKFGFEVRSDSRFGENGEMRWLEVAPPGSRARLALNPPLGVQVGDLMQAPGAPLLFMASDPDGNHIAVVEEPPAG